MSRFLFHHYDDKQSTEKVSQVSISVNYESIDSIMNSLQSNLSLKQLTWSCLMLKLISHCSQQLKLALIKSMSSLSLKTSATEKQVQHRNYSENNLSRYSSVSFKTINSSILVDRNSKSFSLTETDLTSDLTSSSLLFRKFNNALKHKVVLNFWNLIVMINSDLSLSRQILWKFNQN